MPLSWLPDIVSLRFFRRGRNRLQSSSHRGRRATEAGPSGEERFFKGEITMRGAPMFRSRATRFALAAGFAMVVAAAAWAQETKTPEIPAPAAAPPTADPA